MKTQNKSRGQQKWGLQFRLSKFLLSTFACAFCFLLSTLALRADLTAVVTPGYQFPVEGAVAPTYDLLNLLGQPTVTIHGTVGLGGGSNSISLTPGSVCGNQLCDGLPDGITMGWNANNPRQLQVLAAGVGGIMTSNGTFWLNIDQNYFAMSTNTVANTNDTTGSIYINWLTLRANSVSDVNIKANAGIQPSKLGLSANALAWGQPSGGLTNVPGQNLLLGPQFAVATVTNGNLSGPGLTLAGQPLFTSTQVAVSGSGTILNQAHGFPYVPQCRAVLVCTTGEYGYAAGDEETIGTGSYGANAVNVWFTRDTSGTIVLRSKTTGADCIINNGHWQVKMYAW
jgi:hypothetical protein